MCCGNNINESMIHLPAHIGTHIDLPFHFYKNGQTIQDYPAHFWIFSHPIFLTINPTKEIIFHEIINAIEYIEKNKLSSCDCLIVKTGIGQYRGKEKFWSDNPGFSPDLYDFFKKHLPALRLFGFDSISLSSFQHRNIGREAHLKFLNPQSPILILEDMKLDAIDSAIKVKKLIVAPIRIEKCDGLPCTVIAIH